MKCTFNYVIFVTYISIISGFYVNIFNKNMNTGRKSSSIHQMTMISTSSKIAVIGVAGGAAETVTNSLLEKGVQVSLLLNESPYSPDLKQKSDNGASPFLYFSDYDKNMAVSNKESVPLMNFLDGKIVIMIDDCGDENLVDIESKDGKGTEGEKIMNKLISNLPKTIKSLVCASKYISDSETNKIGQIFGTKTSFAYKQWCEQNNIPYINLQYGQLIGGIVGREPLPFVGLPLKEPEVDPSYVLRAVVINDVKSNKFAATEKFTRDSLAQAIIQAIQLNLVKDQKVLEALLISIVGKPPLENDWKQLFSRVSNSQDIDIVSIPFQEIVKPAMLLNWISDTWFPQALIDADAAIILTGARPVRATNIKNPTDGSKQIIKIVWEDLKPDLTSVTVGYLEISLNNVGSTNVTENPPSLVVKRMANGILPGEMQLMDRLVEGVNKNVYKKQFCIPLNTAASSSVGASSKR